MEVPTVWDVMLAYDTCHGDGLPIFAGSPPIDATRFTP